MNLPRYRTNLTEQVAAIRAAMPNHDPLPVTIKIGKGHESTYYLVNIAWDSTTDIQQVYGVLSSREDAAKSDATKTYLLFDQSQLDMIARRFDIRPDNQH